jgi:hypothetical protein
MQVGTTNMKNADLKRVIDLLQERGYDCTRGDMQSEEFRFMKGNSVIVIDGNNVLAQETFSQQFTARDFANIYESRGKI